MLTKKVSRKVSPATYLSPKERQKAVLLIKAIRSSENVEEILKYQNELEELIEKANVKKAGIREHARILRAQDRATVSAHYRNKKSFQRTEDETSMSAGN